MRTLQQIEIAIREQSEDLGFYAKKGDWKALEIKLDLIKELHIELWRHCLRSIKK